MRNVASDFAGLFPTMDLSRRGFVVTTLARSVPSILRIDRAFATNASTSRLSPEAITPRITPF